MGPHTLPTELEHHEPMDTTIELARDDYHLV
eukprot:CAMPEP_0185745920 /NCGR_PEP_ID=MMETSP1174-20130828/4316_1 /TAXON_ID=35687 /ORGANISM="Dictyocha speculum, Strain CCMP1381" /LENGTH=30 /DNA_ID= /DNA_START= /DNA_END= /DNA_ORIENTATION=